MLGLGRASRTSWVRQASGVEERQVGTQTEAGSGLRTAARGRGRHWGAVHSLHRPTETLQGSGECPIGRPAADKGLRGAMAYPQSHGWCGSFGTWWYPLGAKCHRVRHVPALLTVHPRGLQVQGLCCGSAAPLGLWKDLEDST